MQTGFKIDTDRPIRPMPGLQVNDISDVLGAEIVGLDVTSDRLEAEWDRIQTLLRDHHVLVFRNQELTEDGLEKFARRFGELERSVTQRADGTIAPPVHMITNLDAEGKPSRTPYVNSNYFWHSDRAFFPTGSAMVLLYGMEMPPGGGGDTQFANMILAYEGLSDADKALVADLRVLHSFEHMRETLMKRPLSELERKVAPPPSLHPLVRTDPVTGRKSLLLGMYACEIDGMPREEARALLKRLEEHATRPEFVYTHKWQEHDFIIWDNLCLMHRALPNFEMEKYRRIMMRCGVTSTAIIQ